LAPVVLAEFGEVRRQQMVAILSLIQSPPLGVVVEEAMMEVHIRQILVALVALEDGELRNQVLTAQLAKDMPVVIVRT
jgi:hypothetical protein